MLSISAFLALGLVLLVLGAEGLVRGSSSLARRLGLTPLVIGLTVVAFGTSSPELFVSLQAALAGSGDIALGNVVGSNIANVALILGISVMIRPVQVQAQLIRWDVPVMIACSLLLVGLLVDHSLSRLEGGLLLGSLIAYTAFNVHQARKETTAVQAQFDEGLPAATTSVGLDLAFLGGGLALLVLGGDLLVDNAVRLAERLGLSEAVIGLTIVAIGTSLPELATSLVAAVRGEGDIALGNVVGSNIFNILCILGVPALLAPIQAGEIQIVELGLMTGLALLLLPLMRTGFRLVRWEGAVLVAGYIAFVLYALL